MKLILPKYFTLVGLIFTLSSCNGQVKQDKIEDNIMTYPYKRICRIRGNFNRLIHHNYWHYRGRIDLNEINLIEYNE